MTRKQQSALGVARAISYYTSLKYAVFIPVTDISKYDLLIDNGNGVKRVEVKTTSQKNGQVGLRTKGGNQSWNGEIKRISPTDCDLVFLVNTKTGAEKEYKSTELEGRNCITLK